MLIVPVEFEIGDPMGGPDAIDLVPRRPGMHISHIASDLYQKLYPGKRQPFEDMDAETQLQMQAYREMGFMWEEVFTQVFRTRQFGRNHRQNRGLMLQASLSVCEHGVEFEHTPCPQACAPSESTIITLSPDGNDTIDRTLEEYKCTWRSSSRLTTFEEDFWDWLVQTKAYCFVLRYLRVRFFMYFVNGNYAPRKPHVRRMDIEFTPEDLIKNWNMLMGHRRRMLAK